MSQEENKFQKFFKNLWHELEPIVTELIIYSIVIFLVAIVAYFTEPYLDEKLKDAVHTIKWIVVIGALGLFAVHTIVKIFIRMCVGIFLEGKEGVEKIRQTGRDNRSSNDEDTDESNLMLNEKSANFDTLKKIQDEKTEKIGKEND